MFTTQLCYFKFAVLQKNLFILNRIIYINQQVSSKGSFTPLDTKRFGLDGSQSLKL